MVRSGSRGSRSQTTAASAEASARMASSTPRATPGAGGPAVSAACSALRVSKSSRRSATQPVSALETATVSRMSDTATSPNSSAGVHWDLSSLFVDDAAAQDALAGALSDSQTFRERYRGHVAELDAAGLATALAALSELDNRLSRIGSYAGLALSVNISGEAERDLNAAVEQGMVEAQNALRFFELEWLEVDDARAAELAASQLVEKDRHYLESMRRFRPHTRSEAEEDMLAEREPAAIGAWHTLFDQVLSSLQIPFEGRERTLDETLAFVRDDQRETRIAAYEAVFEALEPHTPVLAHVYDTLVADRLVMDRVRSLRRAARAARPVQRAAAGGGRRDALGDRGRLPAGPPLVAAQGPHPGSRPARPGRPVRPDGRGPALRLGRGHRHRARRARPLRPAHRADRDASSWPRTGWTPSRARASAAARSAPRWPRTPGRSS